AARVAADPVAVELLYELRRRLARADGEDLLQRSHVSLDRTPSVNRGQNGVRTGSDRGQIGVRSGSDPVDGACNPIWRPRLLPGPGWHCGWGPLGGLRTFGAGLDLMLHRMETVVTRPALLPRHVLPEILEQDLPPAAYALPVLHHLLELSTVCCVLILVAGPHLLERAGAKVGAQQLHFRPATLPHHAEILEQGEDDSNLRFRQVVGRGFELGNGDRLGSRTKPHQGVVHLLHILEARIAASEEVRLCAMFLH